MNIKLPKALTVIAFTLVVAGMVVLYWGVRPYSVMTFISPVEVWNPNGAPIIAGERAFWRASYDKTMPLEATIKAQLINDFVIYYSPFTSNVPVGRDVLSSEFKIPNFIEGECYLYVTITYSPNPLRTVTYTVKSKPFYVHKKKCKEEKPANVPGA